MRSAQALATEAVEALKLNESFGSPIVLDTQGFLLSLDTAWLSDGLVVNLIEHREIKKAPEQAARMLGQVEALLTQVKP